MTKWEYLFIQSFVSPLGGAVYVISSDGERQKLAGTDREGTEIIKILNKYGALGWEVTGVDSTMPSATVYTTTWTFKRPVGTAPED
jgi:hypothetical protein